MIFTEGFLLSIGSKARMVLSLDTQLLLTCLPVFIKETLDIWFFWYILALIPATKEFLLTHFFTENLFLVLEEEELRSFNAKNLGSALRTLIKESPRMDFLGAAKQNLPVIRS